MIRPHWREYRTKPIRIRLSRAKGYRLPPNTRSVSRPGPFGNPYRVESVLYQNPAAAWCVAMFRDWLNGKAPGLLPGRRAKLLARLPELRGKNLACWCALDKPCHADVLIEFANRD